MPLKRDPANPNFASSRTVIRRSHDDRGRAGMMSEKSKSFHGQVPRPPAPLHRPKTQPELYAGVNVATLSPGSVAPPRLTKLLLNVTVQRSLGPVQVLISPEATVEDLIREAIRLYARERRRPLLPTIDPASFGLHYSQFSLESLDPKEKLIGLGSRNFFMCPNKPIASASCSNEADKASKTGFSWLRFMDFML